MELYSGNNDYKLYYGNMLDLLEVIDKETIDSIITDPPYELNFMSKNWDNSGIAFQKETWQKCYEVLKPGGYLLAFGGSRTFHRIACAIEDAGFEIRDTIMWLYGSGFPKSQNIGKMYDKKMGNERKIIGETRIGKTSLGDSSGWDTSQNMKDLKTTGKVDITKGNSQFEGWGSALKPSYEPIIVARKPFKGSLVDNVIEYGVGGINIDECRIGNEKRIQQQAGYIRRGRTNEEVFMGIDNNKPSEPYGVVNGRFPANTILTYDEIDFDEVCGGFPQSKGCKNIDYSNVKKKNIYGGNSLQKSKTEYTGIFKGYDDDGSASRYFYCAKASRKDRDCDGIISNTHPTCKPCTLMQYLVRLVTPNNGIILDPFNGSGSTGKAVMYENKERNKGYKYIGIELTEEYLPIAKTRIEYVCNLIDEEKKQDKQMTIFDLGDSNE